MKQDTGKKTPKWLWIVIAIVALLAAAAVVVVLMLNPGQNGGEVVDPSADIPASAVYWNLDRAANTDPETGLSAREAGEDGLYTIRFASEGKIIELKTSDKQLVNYIDTMDAVGLVLDENGLIIDVLNVKDIAIEKAKNFYVKKVDGNTITVIEGNYADMVKRRTLAVNGRYIRGYVCPMYSKIATKKAPAKKEEPKPKKTILEIAKEVIDGKWGVGEERRKKLIKAGYDYDKVQKKVNELLGSKDYAVTRTSANLREGPGMSYQVVKHLDKGTKVERLKKVGRWTRVKAKGKVGYIWSARLK